MNLFLDFMELWRDFRPGFFVDEKTESVDVGCVAIRRDQDNVGK